MNSYTQQLKDEPEVILHFSNIPHKHLQDKIIGPRIKKANKRLESEKRPTGGCIMLF